ncbi:hypothetical protein DTO013E5_8371 [Penicillium roqueforti]|nr:hypothetical protein DTO013F2_8997 [Penicillium roqueforti]KAI2743445.1 hypothetical protein DTO012A1_3359 [Penicillium roqueforti]KAI3201969.1 hypothetical protein DTO013E5_8371 [Penicillium roqueforti]
MDVNRLNELEMIDPRPLPPWRKDAFTEIELEPDRETARDRAVSAKDTSNIVVYSDASRREGHLGAAIVALNDNDEVTESQQNVKNRSEQRITHTILQAATEVQAGHIALRLQWMPGHYGNVGNETADRLAKEAAQPGKTHPFRPLLTRENAFLRSKTHAQ